MKQKLERTKSITALHPGPTCPEWRPNGWSLTPFSLTPFSLLESVTLLVARARVRLALAMGIAP